MKINVMKKWVAALESGEYKQGIGQLREGNTYCCLGVLCEIAKKEGVIKSYAHHSYFPTKKVLKWAGMKTENGDIEDTSLARLNDGESENTTIKTKNGNLSVRFGRKMSFKNIVKVIKEYHKEL